MSLQISIEVYSVVAEILITLPLIILMFKEIESLIEKVKGYINAMNALSEDVAALDNEAIDHLYTMIEDLKIGRSVKNVERPKIVRNREIENAKRKFGSKIDEELKKEVELKITAKKYAKQVLIFPVLVVSLSMIFYIEGLTLPFVLPLTIISTLLYLHLILHFELRKEITELIERAKEIVYPKSQNLG